MLLWCPFLLRYVDCVPPIRLRGSQPWLQKPQSVCFLWFKVIRKPPSILHQVWIPASPFILLQSRGGQAAQCGRRVPPTAGIPAGLPSRPAATASQRQAEADRTSQSEGRVPVAHLPGSWSWGVMEVVFTADACVCLFCKVIQVEEEMRMLLEETESTKRAMEQKMARLTSVLKDFWSLNPVPLWKNVHVCCFMKTMHWL